MTSESTAVESDELVPGMAAQGKGVKCYVESDYAPLKACIVGNPSSIVIPDPDTWEMGNMFAHSGEEFNAYLRKHKGKHMKGVDPKRYDKIVHESDSLAEAYRQGLTLPDGRPDRPDQRRGLDLLPSQNRHQ